MKPTNKKQMSSFLNECVRIWLVLHMWNACLGFYLATPWDSLFTTLLHVVRFLNGYQYCFTADFCICQRICRNLHSKVIDVRKCFGGVKLNSANNLECQYPRHDLVEHYSVILHTETVHFNTLTPTMSVDYMSNISRYSYCTLYYYYYPLERNKMRCYVNGKTMWLYE